MAPTHRARKPAAVARISDVARAAGVSPATVSRVLNDTGTVSAARADRVRRVAAEMGYQPFGPARALRQQRTRVWAAIIADIENPFFTAMVRGIEDVARDAGYRLVLCNSDEDLAREASYLDVALGERMAGVVIAVASTRDSDLDVLLDNRVPVVAVDRSPLRHGETIDSVVVDNRSGAAEATAHLLAGGSKRPACLTGPSRVSTATERLAGFRDAVSKARRKVDPAYVKRSNFREEGGYQSTLALLALKAPPDALFVANNLMTLGALRAINEVGLKVPDDIALVGFDDAPWTTLTTPALTVVAQPTYEIGREAAKLLATHQDGQPPRHIVLAPKLLVRGSTRPERSGTG